MAALLGVELDQALEFAAEGANGGVCTAGNDNAPGQVVISGGTVVDPSQDLSDRRDVAINDGLIAAVEPRIEHERAAKLLDATGLLVTPGLVDVHVHVYPGVSHYGVEPDADVLTSGVTTALDAGSAGASTFDGLRRYVIDVSATRLLACLNISGLGMVSPDVLPEVR